MDIEEQENFISELKTLLKKYNKSSVMYNVSLIQEGEILNISSAEGIGKVIAYGNFLKDLGRLTVNA